MPSPAKSCLVAAVALLALAGCVSSSSSRTTTAIAAPLDDAAMHDWTPVRTAPTQGVTVSVERPAPSMSTDEEPRVPRAPRRLLRARTGRIDVRVVDADLENVLRMLADRAGVGLVVDGPLGGTVTLELRRVRPLDALVTIAEAHGATVEEREGILVVRR